MTPVLHNQKIAVLCGGPSSEAEVSRRSGKNCFEALKRLGYQNTLLMEVDKTIATRLKEESVDVAYIALHGKYGEDGCIQGLLEVLQIPYTGSRLQAMALTIDKDRTKVVLEQAGLPVAKSITVFKGDKTVSTQIAEAKLNYPVMIKPLQEGSSVGMSKVDAETDLQKAMDFASEYSDKLMIEQFITGKDLTVGVLEKNGQPIATPILELKSKTGWYDYEAKYTPGLTEFILPATLDETLTQKVQQLAIQAHQVAQCQGVSRVDFVLDTQTQQPYILEINTIPGMTDVSDLPAQAKAMGVSYDELVEWILQSATLS